MSISIYSIIMAIIWFSLAALIGSFALRKTTKGGLLFVALIFILALFRGFVPIEFSNTVIIRSKHWYPFLQGLIQKPLSQSITVGIIILCVWLVGSVFRFIFVCRKLFLLHRFRKNVQLEQPHSKLVKLAAEVANELKYAGDIDLAVSHYATTAYQAGFMRPFILLPANICSFTEGEIRCMLRHELCHFLGNDLWIKTALHYMTCILWWNPVIAILNPSIEQMLELRCDQRAYNGLPKDSQLCYLETLLHLAKNNSSEVSPLTLGYVGNNGDADIMQRFKLIVEDSFHIVSNFKTKGIVAVCLLLFTSSYFITIQPWTALPVEQDRNSTSNPETAYIIHTSDDQFILFIDGMHIAISNEEELNKEPFCNYKIYEGGSFNEEILNYGS